MLPDRIGRTPAGYSPGLRYTAGRQAHPEMFQDVREKAGCGRDWASRDLGHTFVSLLSDDGMAIEKIARLAGHASSDVTRDRVPARAPAGPAGGRGGDGPALRQRQR
jgi:integrase